MNAGEIFNNLALTDIYVYVDHISHELEEQRKSKSGKDFHKALVNIRDILNFMYPQ